MGNMRRHMWRIVIDWMGIVGTIIVNARNHGWKYCLHFSWSVIYQLPCPVQYITTYFYPWVLGSFINTVEITIFYFVHCLVYPWVLYLSEPLANISKYGFVRASVRDGSHHAWIDCGCGQYTKRVRKNVSENIKNKDRMISEKDFLY